MRERYRERVEALGRSSGFAPLEIVEIRESRARRDADRRAEEARAILATGGPTALVAFDERGTPLTSEGFAERLARLARSRPAVGSAFVIGGADGLDPSVRERAALVLSFGALTLPHQLVRVLVLEQLYRGLTILAGHPYHRAGGSPPEVDADEPSLAPRLAPALRLGLVCPRARLAPRRRQPGGSGRARRAGRPRIRRARERGRRREREAELKAAAGGARGGGRSAAQARAEIDELKADRAKLNAALIDGTGAVRATEERIARPRAARRHG